MAIDKVSVFNLALTRIGGDPTIQGPNEISAEMEQLTAVYDFSLQATLAAYDWNFARRKEALASTGNTPHDWLYEYTYPADCIVVRRLSDGNRKLIDIPFEIVLKKGLQEKVIQTDLEGAYAIYTAPVTSIRLFTDQFIEALSWKLGAEVALGLTGDKGIRADCLDAFTAFIGSASADSLDEGMSDEPAEPDHLAARQ